MQRYNVLRKIGKGSFGTVELIRRRTDGKSFVLKRMKIGSVSKKEREMCHNEVQLLERLNHPSIVRYEESFINKQHSESYLCVVMAYCDGGDLTNFLKNQRGKRLKEKHVLDLFIQIALALHFVHDRNILHRDLKAQNIFVKNGRLKLGDFGISKVLTGSVAFAQTMIGTPYYMSPEVFKGKPYNFKSDIWSLGCVLYELITFRHCFDANNLNSLASKIIKGKYIPITGNQYRKDIKLLCYSMLNQLPCARPTLNEILKHKLLQNRIRDFYISCYKKFKKNIISNCTFNNLKNQLFQIGLTHILESNIDDDIARKEQKKKLIQKQRTVEKENKIQKDMEDALEKLKIERKWRIAQKKQRQKIYNFGARKREKTPNFVEQKTMADKRRQAAKHRKLQILKQQEQKRQRLAAKHRNKQQRAAKRKNMELNRKMPYSRLKSPKKTKFKIKSNKSPNQKNEEQQVKQLSIWENVHINNNKPIQKPTKITVKQANLIKKPQHKSALSLLQQKIKSQKKESDALETLKKRRELIQQRLSEISERHKQRQLKKQSMYNNNYNYNKQIKQTRSKSEQPFISNEIQSKANINIEHNIAISHQSTPYKKPFMSPNKSQFATESPSPSPSPLKFSNNSSKASSMSVSPAAETDANNKIMNPRQRMEARKRARADLRAKQIKHVNRIEYKSNQLQAQQNKYNNMDIRYKRHDMHMARAVSVGAFDEIMEEDNDADVDESRRGAMSEPAMNELPLALGAIMTIQERSEELQEVEEDIVEEEINELKQTLAQHTKQLEEIKNNILLERKKNLSESDTGDDEVEDVESLLNQQEQTMKTMRFNQENNNIQNKNKNIHLIPNDDNRMDEDDENDDIFVEDENGSDDESSEEMPIGRLVDRIEFIKKKCTNGMGLDGFKIAYNLMKQLQFEDKAEFVTAIDNKIRQLCKNSNVSKSRVQKYRSLIDQLLFIEANCS